MRKTSYGSLLVIGLLTLFLAMASTAKADYLITSLAYQITPAAQTAAIGDNIYFNMCVLNPSVTYSNVSVVVNVLTTSIELSDLAFPAIVPNTVPGSELFVYDGVHTWKITSGYTNAAIRSVTINNQNLIAGWPVGDYTSIQNASFSAAQGVPPGYLIPLFIGNATIDIGTAQTGIVLYDDGSALHNDVEINPSLIPVAPINAGVGANDGIYNGIFAIRENYQFNLVNASIVGHFNSGGSAAGNDGFVSPQQINISGIRPSVELVDASPNPFNPNTTVEKFYYYLTEDCSLKLSIFYNNVTIKTLNAQGTGNITNYIQWDGIDDAGDVTTDGRATYRFDLTDSAGNTGIPYVGNLIITSVRVNVSIDSIDTKNITTGNEFEVSVIAQVTTEIDNATPQNLANLGFDPAVYGANSYQLYPWIYTDLKIYGPDGTLLGTWPRDLFTTSDEDAIYINSTLPLPGYQGLAYPGYNYAPASPSFCILNPVAGVVYTDPDGNNTDDWNIVFDVPLTNMGNGVYKKTESYPYTTASNSLNSGTPYILKANGILVGKTIEAVGNIVQVSDTCVTSTTLLDQLYHVQPSFFVDSFTGWITDYRGFGVCGTPRTAMFTVDAEPGVPLPDTTGPVIVANTEYPSDGSTIEPGVVSKTNYVKVTMTDAGVGAGTSNMSSFTLNDPYGNLVPGTLAWNGGVAGTKTWEVYYIPNNPLTIGGKYNVTVVPKDALGNMGATYQFSFIVTDTSIPLVTGINVQSSTGSTQILSPSTSTQVTFPVVQVNATLISGGTAAVDWTKSSLAVTDAAGNNISGVDSPHTAGTNLLVFIPANPMYDASYKAVITAVSVNSAQGAYTYNFYISTAGVTYVDVTPTGENSSTGMVVSVFTAASSGITDNTSPTPVTISPSTLAVNVVPPASVAANNSYTLFGTAVSFTAISNPMPISFNSTMCSASVRLHYTDAELTALQALGLSESNLTAWEWNGSSWTQLKNLLTPVVNAGDHYISLSITDPANPNSIQKTNIFALMFVPPSGPSVVSKPPANTKIFNPGQGPAKIHYTQNAAAIGLPGGTGNVKVYIFSLNGSLLRTMDYQNNTDYFASFYDSANGHLYYDPDNVNPAINYYYFLWDGKNDHGTVLRNGMYIIKTEITSTTGVKTTASRTIALIK